MYFVERNRKANRQVTYLGNLTRHHETGPDQVVETGLDQVVETDLDQEVNPGVDMAGQGQVGDLDMAVASPDHEVDRGHEPSIGDIPAQGQEEEGQDLHHQGHHLGHGQDGEV